MSLASIHLFIHLDSAVALLWLTLIGDLPRRIALDQTARGAFSSPTLVVPAASTPDSAVTAPEAEEAPVSIEELQKRIEEWNEIAAFLRKNIVQGEKDESGSYSESTSILILLCPGEVIAADEEELRVTSDTELGSNETVKEPPKLPTTPFPNRNRRKCGEA